MKIALRGNELLVLSSDQPVFELLQNLTANFPVVQEPYMVFKVQSCSTARLGLKEDAENDGKLWEITFDIGSLDEVLVRRNVGAGIKSRGDIIVDNCKDNLTFFVSWRNSLVQVFQQHGGRWLTVLKWFDAKGRDVSFVGVSGVATWTVYDDHETGIDLPAGSTTSETMSGLNDIEHNLTELEEEEHRANLALYALQYLLDTGFEGAKTVEDLKAIPGFLEAFRQEQMNRDRKACNEKNIKCRDFKKSPWRSMDGTCNNLIHEGRGSTGTPQVRLVAADYADGVTEFKKLGENGQTLPSAREVSAFVLSEGNSASPPDDPNRTIMMAVMGQFYDHDITETPLTKGYRETTIGCCDIIDEQVRNERIQCKTIEIPANDPFFNHTCMAFKRSLPSRGEDKCEPTVREQINDITAFVDGSMVYGSSEEVAESLRTFSDGKLLVAQDNLLPLNDPSGCILDDADDSHCFLAGDVRVNENANLMVIHTAFVRYHNILCDQLIENNLTDDERIYQIARKIIGGILQNILFGHWLPHVIGEDMMINSGLAVGSSFVYDETVNPSVTLAFSTAALRYGHTLVQGTIKAVHESLKYTNDTALKDTFFRPGIVFSSAADIARSFHTIQGSAVDSALPDDLKDHLFETDTAHGLDLSALNIQRGRDHGLPGYVAYREWAGLSVPTNFDELEHHTTDFQQSLGAMYGDVRDIDLFAGGMTETVITDTHLGPTFTAIFVDQFKRLKFGDRYYFENTDSETGFSEGQIDAIKKVTLGKVMCQAFNFDVMQKDVFDVPSIEDFKQCSEYDELDMRLFTDIGDEE
ncbi:peroxidase-like isoform X1 [Argopecten irradians]|uniref:peroxidase-like isoform X1 n=2 Tax=Argopecten irradians TaxID=31199 RepID=UPI00371E70F4